jgi:hypothetical protein
MTRITVLQRLIDRLGASFYLEIGVEHGVVLLALRVEERIGVDPKFRISWKRKLLHPFVMRRTRLFEMPSDEFFARHSTALPASGIDVAFIDGLHTYRQSWVDLENCVERLAPGGVIVMHDCNPETPEAASPLQDWDPWCGEVWKSIVRARSLRPDLSAYVLDADFGLAIITKEPAKYPMLPYSEEEIEKASYADLAGHREDYLGLRPASYFEEFLAGLSPLRKNTR